MQNKIAEDSSSREPSDKIISLIFDQYTTASHNYANDIL